MLPRIVTYLLLYGFAASVQAQQGAPAVPTGVIPGAGQTTEAPAPDVKTGPVNLKGQDQRASQPSRRSGPGYVPPMDIRIKEEGIGMPKCARESREGEACSK